MRTTDAPARKVPHPDAGPALVYSLLPTARQHWQPALTGMARRLLATVAQPMSVDAQPLVFSASIGVALFPGDAQDRVSLTRCAEQAG